MRSPVLRVPIVVPAVLVALGVAAVGFQWTRTTVTTSCSFPVEASPSPVPLDLTRTDIGLHTKVPIGADRNVLWCATTQLAWDAVADVIGKGGRLALGPPAPSDVVAEMNRRAFPHGDLDPKDRVAVGGWGSDGVAERVRAAVRERFGSGATIPRLDIDPLDAVGFAMLRKDLPFETVFHVHPEPVSFAGGPARVRAFGCPDSDVSPNGRLMARQIIAFLPAAGDSEPDEFKRHPVVELLAKGRTDRILLSALPPRATLEDTWIATSAWIAEAQPEICDEPQELYVPTIRLDVSHVFTELTGSPVEGVPHSRVEEIRQSVRLSLTESGAALESVASTRIYGGYGGVPPLRFDRPFLLVLIQKGATRPYLLLWIGNDDLLVKIRSEPAPEDATRAFAGGWTLDRGATAQADAEWEVKSLESDPEFEKHREVGANGVPLTREALVARTREQYERREPRIEWVTVDTAGVATFSRRDSELSPEDVTWVARFRMDDGRLVLVAAKEDEKKWYSGPGPHLVEIRDGLLRVAPASNPLGATFYRR